MKSTICNQIFNIANKYKNKTALQYKKNGIWEEISYSKLTELTKTITSYLLQISKKPEQSIAILSENRWEWLVTDLGIINAKKTVVPLHSTNCLEINNYVLKNSDSEILFISEKEVAENNLPELIEGTKIEKIIVYGKLPEIKTNIEITSFENILNSTELIEDVPKVTKETNCYILYTSGTTGMPKGVVLSHHNIVTDISQALQIISVKSTDTFLSFLPYSHAFEHTAGFLTPLFTGATVAIAESTEKLSDNLQEIRPTIMTAVPRIFEKVHDKIMDNINHSSSIKQKLFNWALNTSDHGNIYSKRLADLLVLRKIRKKLGGRIRFFVSGGSSLFKEVAEFFYKTGILIIEGYGMTETSPFISVNSINSFKFGTIGKPLPETQIKIAEDNELLVKGPQTTTQYYKDPVHTKELFTDDGWLKTGDIARIDADGFISIVDRKKEIIVLSTGHNVAPQRVENALNFNKYIQQSMVYGDNKKVLCAFIVPDFEELKIWYKEKFNNIPDKNEVLIRNPIVVDLFKEEIKETLKTLGRHEQVGEFKLLPRAFSQEIDELSPTLKLKRKNIINHFSRNLVYSYCI